MNIEFRFPTVAAPTSSWVPTRQPRYGLEESADYPDQVILKTGDGVEYVQDQGARLKIFALSFTGLTTTDRDNYLVFFDAVKKGLRPFEYKDRYGASHTVRITNAFELTETAFVASGTGWFSGTIELRQA